ncbi:MAG: 5-(carboxyamino)imidazole ribonucleotide synthase, partial [Micromonosporaceae bacterium]|nr:5-(carboxyamino)imidazole ribonucleotide synthase [Micromonosporaceae bacterium]
MDKRTGLPVVGMVGGGQLARMSYQAAIGLGQSLRVLTVPGDERIGRVAPDCRFGDLTSITALREFGGECDLLTVVDDRVSGEHCAALRAEGLSITPGAASMECARDSAALRRQLADLGVADAGNRFAAAGDRFAAAGGGWTSSAGTSDP